jgi:hypothetical protein
MAVDLVWLAGTLKPLDRLVLVSLMVADLVSSPGILIPLDYHVLERLVGSRQQSSLIEVCTGY